MIGSGKSRSRREEIRKNRPDAARWDLDAMRESGVLHSVAIAAGFFVAAAAILMLRQDVVRYRPDQWIPHDIVSRVDFVYPNKAKQADEERKAREREPRVYRDNGDVWASAEKELLSLPDRLVEGAPEQLPPETADVIEPGAVTALRQYVSGEGREAYAKRVRAFVGALREYRAEGPGGALPLLILPGAQRQQDVEAARPVVLSGEFAPATPVDPTRTYAHDGDAMKNVVTAVAQLHFRSSLQADLVDFTIKTLRPTHELDERATTEAQNRAAKRVPTTAGDEFVPANSILVHKSKRVFTQDDWKLLRAEHEAYQASIPGWAWKSRLGVAGMVAIVTVVLAGYVATYQRRVIRNHARAVAIAALLLAMLLVAQIAGIGNGPLFFFGIAPTILVAVILTIAYDQRFAMGVSTMHGLLVTVALDQGVTFFLILFVGVLTVCYCLDDIRTRSKLIEVGGFGAAAMIAATAAAATLSLDPWPFVLRNCLHAGAAGLAVGFVALGILPFVEKAFRITTSMTLLELADASQPLLRRLAMEAPGTYNHSLQVATLAESAAEAIKANSLLCRVGSYYHDVGKINKAEYFIENQAGGENRHLNLSPSVSLLIIIGHVKDGVELAKEYNLPTVLVNFIQQHHGTTLVEYFYHQARTRQDQGLQPDQPAISETQYRYPGPKPRTKECAIVMLADAVESACRALPEPNASRVETLVHDLSMKRLLDGQFDESELTMRELEVVERSLVKSLLGIYHGRIAYPSMANVTAPPPTPAAEMAAARSA